MSHHWFSHAYIWWIVVFILFFGMMLFTELGHRWGRSHFAVDPKGARTGLTGIEAAVFSLFGLLIAFTFSGAATRFDQRRLLIMEESNDISTAYLRLDLLPPAMIPEMQGLFRQYLSTRLDAYRALPNVKLALAEVAKAEEIQKQIWHKAVPGCQSQASTACTIVLLPALNTMFDIANTRLLVTTVHPPAIIFFLLFLLGLCCAFMAGFAMSEGQIRKWGYSLIFPIIIATTVYIILDLEFPRIGFIQVSDVGLERILDSMK